MAEGVSYLYVCSLLTVLYLFLPWRGYERMMEGKYFCFVALTLGYLAAMLRVSPRNRVLMTPTRICAALYLACSALSALCSPYGTETLLGGTRKDGLVTIALYVLLFFLLSRYFRPDGRVLALAAGAVTLCDVLVLLQMTGRNPLRLYPEELTYFDGDAAYAGFYAGTSGNIDFTAFLLALAFCVFLAAALRGRRFALLPTALLTLWTLYRLDVAAAWVGIFLAAVWGPALLVSEHRRLAAAVSALLTLLALVLIRRYAGAIPALREASRLLHGEVDSSFGSWRVWIWQNCVPLVKQRPLLGGGPDTLRLRGLEPFVRLRDGVPELSEITAAHNEYLNILVNQGAAALTAYAGALLCGIARCFRGAASERRAVCGAGLLCYAGMAFFSISTCITAPYVWLLLAIAQEDEIQS